MTYNPLPQIGTRVRIAFAPNGDYAGEYGYVIDYAGPETVRVLLDPFGGLVGQVETLAWACDVQTVDRRCASESSSCA